MKILVTGGHGFIGSHLVDKLLELEHEVQDVDCLTYAADPDIRSHKSYLHINKRIQDVRLRHINGPIDIILHLAAESHVDNSILGPKEFFDTNVMGTLNMLQLAKELKVSKFIQMSTDECLGDLGPNDPPFTVTSSIRPRGPYAASKASAEHLVNSFYLIYGLPTSIVRSCNAYGQRQNPEKFIPRAITKILSGQKVPLFGTGLNVRQWLYVKDLVRGLCVVMDLAKPGETYHLGPGQEKTNKEVVDMIISLLGKGEIEYVEDRKAHDRRYSLAPNIDCIKGITNFENGLEKTVKWYCQNTAWWHRAIDRGGIW